MVEAVRRLLAAGISNPAVAEALRQWLQSRCGVGVVGNAKGVCRAKGYCYYHQGRREQRTAAHKDSLGELFNPSAPADFTPQKNLARGENALNRAMRQRRDVKRAMYTPECGYIDFNWGNPGIPEDDYKKGGGLSHIATKHPRDLKHIPEVIAKGKAYKMPREKGYAQRIAIIHDERVVFLDRQGKYGAFVVSGYRRGNMDVIKNYPRAEPVG